MSQEEQKYRIEIAPPDTLRAIEASAGADLQHYFALMKQGLEKIPGVDGDSVYAAPTLQALAVQPAIFSSWLTAEYHTIKRGTVPARVKELVALAVAKHNEEDVCAACGPYHEGAARLEGATADEIEAAGTWPRTSEQVDPVDSAVDFAMKCAFSPKTVTREDVDGMRAAGYGDTEILEIAAAALIAYSLSSINRIFEL